MSLPGTKLRSLPGSVSLVGELGLPASLGCVPRPGQCMGPLARTPVWGQPQSQPRGFGHHAPLSGHAEKVLGKAHLNKALFNRAESNHAASYNPRVTYGRASASTVPVACQPWPFGSVATGTWCPSWTWCSASAACSAGTKPLTCSKGCRAEWGCGYCSLLTNQFCSSSSGQGGIAQTPGWEGGSWLLGQEEVGRVEVAEQRSAETQVGQEHCIKYVSLPLTSGDLWGAAVRDVAAAEVSSSSHPAAPCGCQLGV